MRMIFYRGQIQAGPRKASPGRGTQGGIDEKMGMEITVKGTCQKLVLDQDSIHRSFQEVPLKFEPHFLGPPFQPDFRPRIVVGDEQTIDREYFRGIKKVDGCVGSPGPLPMCGKGNPVLRAPPQVRPGNRKRGLGSQIRRKAESGGSPLDNFCSQIPLEGPLRHGDPLLPATAFGRDSERGVQKIHPGVVEKNLLGFDLEFCGGKGEWTRHDGGFHRQFFDLSPKAIVPFFRPAQGALQVYGGQGHGAFQRPDLLESGL
jgi:hypothetical protein